MLQLGSGAQTPASPMANIKVGGHISKSSIQYLSFFLNSCHLQMSFQKDYFNMNVEVVIFSFC